MPRWDNLFDDLESQLAQELDAEEIGVAAEEERLRLGRLALRDRLVGAMAADADSVGLLLEVRGGAAHEVVITSVGRDWIAGDLVGTARSRRACVIPLAAIVSVIPRRGQLVGSLDGRTVAGDSLSARLGLPFVLRDLCRRRTAVDIGTPWGELHGSIDRVGRDHLDLAEHDTGAPRRDAAVRRTRILPFSELTIVIARP